MDPNGRIYRDLPENIPDEDKARLDGYLIARSEIDEKERMVEELRVAYREKALRDVSDEGVPWRIAGQGAVNQYHEVVVLERGNTRIGVWLPRDADLDFVVSRASVQRADGDERAD